MKPLDRVVYISGPHGSGKSTLAAALVIAGRGRFIPHVQGQCPHLEDSYERMAVRVDRYVRDRKEQERMAAGFCQDTSRPRFVIANRCIYDNVAYGMGFLELGWITSAQMRAHEEKVAMAFGQDHLPRNVIYLASPQAWIEENLKRRWQERKPKWREENFDYLRRIINGFERLYADEPCNVLRLTETDLTLRVRQCLYFLERAKSRPEFQDGTIKPLSSQAISAILGQD